MLFQGGNKPVDPLLPQFAGEQRAYMETAFGQDQFLGLLSFIVEVESLLVRDPLIPLAVDE
jgi:hypothetical protein